MLAPIDRDRDELVLFPGDEAVPARPAVDDSASHDLGDLWRDLGGGD